MSVYSGGTRPWVVQRVSAAYLAVYVVIFFVQFLVYPVADFIDWRERLSHPALNISTILFVFALLVHGWIGARDVIMDYIHPLIWRFTLLSVLAVYLVAMAVWTVRIMAGLW